MAAADFWRRVFSWNEDIPEEPDSPRVGQKTVVQWAQDRDNISENKFNLDNC